MSAKLQFLLGYGSLICGYSRAKYGDLQGAGFAATVKGWRRSWNVRSNSEQQTYLGIVADQSASVNGALVPVPAFSEELKQRESNYDFHPLTHTTVTTDAPIQDSELWICYSPNVEKPGTQFPIYQSYVDTCLLGCLALGGEEFARQFITTTEGWQQTWYDDRELPHYHRATAATPAQQQQIDDLLASCGVLIHRRPLAQKVPSGFDCERLYTRELRLSDAAFLLRLVNDPLWLKYIGDRHIRDMATAEQYVIHCNKTAYEGFGGGWLVACLREGDVPIGVCTLLHREDFPAPDLGFALLPEFRGQGYAMEMSQGLLHHAKTVAGLDRLWAVASPDNTVSIKLLQALGMQSLGIRDWPTPDSQVHLLEIHLS